MISIAIPRAQRIIWKRIYEHVTLMITLRHARASFIHPGSNAGCVRSINMNYPSCSKCRGSSIARGCGRRQKGQKLTLDLSLLGNVRGRNRSRRATNGRVGNSSTRSPARPSFSRGKLNGTTRMNIDERQAAAALFNNPTVKYRR